MFYINKYPLKFSKGTYIMDKSSKQLQNSKITMFYMIILFLNFELLCIFREEIRVEFLGQNGSKKDHYEREEPLHTWQMILNNI